MLKLSYSKCSNAKALSLRSCRQHLHSTPSLQSRDWDDPPFSPLHKTLISNPIQKTKPHPNKKLSNAPPFPLSSDLPFHFRYSYSESNYSVDPIGYRETPKFSPFGPGRLDRKWTGTYAVASQQIDRTRVEEERAAVLGDPLSQDEVADLVERYRHNDCPRQINLVLF